MKEYMDTTLTAEERTAALMAQMTPEEKVAQLGSYWSYQLIHDGRLTNAEALLSRGIGQITRISGSSGLPPEGCARFANEIQRFLVERTRLGIPALIHEEACSGFTAMGATIYPQTIGVAASFEPEVAREIGEGGARQMRAVGARQALAPLLDVTRDPRWGRVEETYGEDPCVVGRMGGAFIEGMQGKLDADGVIATGKHFVGYGCSEGGMNWAPAHIPARELREVYLAPFEQAVKRSGLASIMNGYHELDGVPCAASRELLTDVLKKEWGFAGTVVSDYFAINQLRDYHRLAETKKEAARIALDSGIDVELPNVDCYGEPLLKAMADGSVDSATVDEAVRKTLLFKFRLGLFEHPFVDEGLAAAAMDSAEDRAAAERLARKTLVLLKNDGVLPLRSDVGKVAVIGPCADQGRALLGDYTFPGQYEGLIELHEAGESNMNQPVPGQVNLAAHNVPVASYREALEARLPGRVRYARGCDVRGDDRTGIAEAVQTASACDVIIAFMGDVAGISLKCTVGESVDRSSLELPGVQEELLRAIAATGKPLVLVLNTGRPYGLEWADAHAAAVLEAWLPGEAGAAAVADTLLGAANPGGRLPITFPRNAGQIPTFYMHKKSGGRSHWRGNYDNGPAAPLYPFGYGLSYTRFAYEDLKLEAESVAIGGTIRLSFTLRNVGERDGDEVVQLYIRDEAASVTRPVKELKGFRRVSLRAGESRRIRFALQTAQLGFYGIDMRYIVEPGEIEVMIGASAEDTRLRARVTLEGEAGYPEKAFFAESIIEEA